MFVLNKGGKLYFVKILKLNTFCVSFAFVKKSVYFGRRQKKQLEKEFS